MAHTRRSDIDHILESDSMSESIVEKLDRLANFQAQLDVFELEKKALIDKIITPEIRAQLEDIEAEFAGQIEAVEANIASLEAEIKQDVIRHGITVKGTFLMAVCNQGRVSWDTASLDSFSQQHPEILGFRRQGEPFTSIRKIP